MIEIGTGRRTGRGLPASRIACCDAVVGPAKRPDEMVKMPCRMGRAEPDLKSQRKQREPCSEPASAHFPLGSGDHGSAKVSASLSVSAGRIAVEMPAVGGIGEV